MELEEALRVAIRKTHQEPGCRRYALHRAVSGTEGLVMIEHWESTDALTEHGRAEAFTSLAAQFEDLLAEPLHVAVLEPLPEGDPHLGRL
nr:antibiotic biosynthesis monooxygenase [Rhodococcus sp. Chr-9]